jgi:hypothetical protein
MSEPPLYLTPTKLRRVNREFLRYVRANFPMRFYRGEDEWALFATAAVLRACDTVESMMLLLSRRKDQDALILLRSLYEQAVLGAWIAIDPDDRHERWWGESQRQLLILHNEAMRYAGPILSADEVETLKGALGMPSVDAMARELDGYWPDRIPGFWTAGRLLSLHGLYQVIYRSGSRPAHGSIDAVSPYVRFAPPYPSIVGAPSEDTMLWYSLAAPVLGMALIIASQRFRWLDEGQIRRFVDRATAETARRRE